MVWIVSKVNVTSNHSQSIMQEYISLGGHYCFEDLPWSIRSTPDNTIYTPHIGTKNNSTAVHW